MLGQAALLQSPEFNPIPDKDVSKAGAPPPLSRNCPPPWELASQQAFFHPHILSQPLPPSMTAMTVLTDSLTLEVQNGRNGQKRLETGLPSLVKNINISY